MGIFAICAEKLGQQKFAHYAFLIGCQKILCTGLFQCPEKISV